MIAFVSKAGHGNAEAERLLSEIADILTKPRSALSVVTFKALFPVKNELHIKRRLSCPSTVPSSCLKACPTGRNKYFDRSEE